MKTQRKLTPGILKSFALVAGLFSIALIMQSCFTHTYVADRPVVRHEVVAPPNWAPAYDNVEEVHYYYLPDIEVYYDVWRNEYVYQNQGNWVYSAYMPSNYSNYNVNDGFVVVLNRNAYEPWRQHRTYASEYPRYYYQTRYNNNNDRSNNGRMRGFNENAKTVIYHNSQNSGGGRNENSGRNSNTPNSRPVNQPTQTRRELTKDNQYQRNNTPSNQPEQTRTRSQPSNSTNQPNSNPPAPQNRREVTRDNPSTPASNPAVRERQDERKPINVAPERRQRNSGETKSEAPRRTQPANKSKSNNNQPARVQQNTPPPQNTNSTDAPKQDENNSRSRR